LTGIFISTYNRINIYILFGSDQNKLEIKNSYIICFLPAKLQLPGVCSLHSTRCASQLRSKSKNHHLLSSTHCNLLCCLETKSDCQNVNIIITDIPLAIFYLYTQTHTPLQPHHLGPVFMRTFTGLH
jgi:hypothetical protein